MTGVSAKDLKKIQRIIREMDPSLADKLANMRLTLREVAEMSAGEVSYSALSKRVRQGRYPDAVSLPGGVHLPFETAMTAAERQKAGPPLAPDGFFKTERRPGAWETSTT